MKLKIGIFTVARSDYGILKKTIIKLENDKKFNVNLYIGSAHDTKIFGSTKKEINKINLKDIKYYKFKYKGSSINSIIKYFAKTVQETETLVKNDNLNAALILGDRYETLAISFVLLNLNIPIIHLCGGSITRGSLDDIYRFSISKMASLHLVETAHHEKNLKSSNIKKNIHIVGAPALENIIRKKDTNYLNNKYNLNLLKKKPIVCCFHPETNLTLKNNLTNLSTMISFLKKIKEEIIFTYPNADHGFQDYIQLINKSFIKHKNVKIIKSFGIKNYYKILLHAKLMIGNSSGGIIESASFKIPCINIGDRQQGRFAPKNIIHSKFEIKDLNKNYLIATDNKFIQFIKKYKNPYFKLNSSGQILKNIYNFLKIKKITQ